MCDKLQLTKNTLKKDEIFILKWTRAFKQNKMFADLKPVMIVCCDLLENMYICVRKICASLRIALHIASLVFCVRPFAICSSIPCSYVVCLSVHLYPWHLSSLSSFVCLLTKDPFCALQLVTGTTCFREHCFSFS